MPVYTNAPGIADLSPLDWRRVGEDLDWTGTEPVRRKAVPFRERGNSETLDTGNDASSKLNGLSVVPDIAGQPDARFQFLADGDPPKAYTQMNGLAHLLGALVAAGVAANMFMPAYDGAPAKRGDIQIAASTVSENANVSMPSDTPAVVDEDTAPSSAATTVMDESDAPKAVAQTGEAQPAWQTDVHSEQVAANTPSVEPPTGSSSGVADRAPSDAETKQVSETIDTPAERTTSASPSEPSQNVAASVAAPKTVPPETVRATPESEAIPNSNPRRATAHRPAPSSIDTAADAGRRQLRLGEKLLARGDLAGARQQFEEAARQGLPEGALALGNTFDPVSLAKVGISAPGDPARARRWYREAYLLTLRPDRTGSNGQARAASTGTQNMGDSRDGTRTP